MDGSLTSRESRFIQYLRQQIEKACAEEEKRVKLRAGTTPEERLAAILAELGKR
jgi:hypothetical protein